MCHQLHLLISKILQEVTGHCNFSSFKKSNEVMNITLGLSVDCPTSYLSGQTLTKEAILGLSSLVLKELVKNGPKRVD